MNFSTIFLIQIIVTVLFTFLAVIFDVKRNIVPDVLCWIMLLVGILSNGILSLISGNVKFILASLISTLATYVVAYMLWQLNMWGGGDVKLLTGIASLIPLGININFLNVFPEMSIYPFSFSVVVNSILVSFPFLILFVLYLIIKNDIFKSNVDFLMNILNINSLIYLKDTLLTKKVPVREVKEGMIIKEYYYNDEWISRLISENNENLKVYNTVNDSEFKFYFKSQSAGGITLKDVYLLKIMFAQGYIKDNLYKRISFPFTPAILAGLLIAIFYGDLVMLFTKNLYLVI